MQSPADGCAARRMGNPCIALRFIRHIDLQHKGLQSMTSIHTTILRTALSSALGIIAVTGALLPTADVQAAAPMVKIQASGYYRMMLGQFEITALSDGAGPLPVDKLLTNTTPAQVGSLLARSYLKAPVETSINAFLINTGSKLLLVDTGAGKLFGPDAAGRLVANLRKAGYQPEDVDAVLLTHIHVDHSGGLTVDGKAVFPNAVIHVDRHDLDFWMDPANAPKVAEPERPSFAQAAASFAPYIAAGKVKAHSGNTQLFPGVRSIETPGHTPGHSFYVVESDGQQLQFWGDLIHAADVQFAAPAVTIRFDVDAPAAAQQRQKAFADATRRGYWVAAAHVSFPGIGHVRRDGAAFAWVPVNYSMAGLNP